MVRNRKTHIVQTQTKGGSTRRSPLKRIREIMWLINLHMPTQGDETRDNHEHEDEDLEDSKEVLESETPFKSEAVDEEGEGDAGEADEAERPAAGVDVGGEENVFAEYE